MLLPSFLSLNFIVALGAYKEEYCGSSPEDEEVVPASPDEVTPPAGDGVNAKLAIGESPEVKRNLEKECDEQQENAGECNVVEIEVVRNQVEVVAPQFTVQEHNVKDKRKEKPEQEITKEKEEFPERMDTGDDAGGVSDDDEEEANILQKIQREEALIIEAEAQLRMEEVGAEEQEDEEEDEEEDDEEEPSEGQQVEQRKRQRQKTPEKKEGRFGRVGRWEYITVDAPVNAEEMAKRKDQLGFDDTYRNGPKGSSANMTLKNIVEGKRERKKVVTENFTAVPKFSALKKKKVVKKKKKKKLMVAMPEREQTGEYLSRGTVSRGPLGIKPKTLADLYPWIAPPDEWLQRCTERMLVKPSPEFVRVHSEKEEYSGTFPTLVNGQQLEVLKNMWRICNPVPGEGGSQEPLYGEINLNGVSRLFAVWKELCGFDQSSQFLDVGSGLAKMVFHAAIDPGGSKKKKQKCLSFFSHRFLFASFLQFVCLTVWS